MSRAVLKQPLQPYSPNIITNASFPLPTNRSDADDRSATSLERPAYATSVYLFPSFQYVTLPLARDVESYHASLDALLRDHVQENSLHTGPLHEEKEIIEEQRRQLGRSTTKLTAIPVDELVVLICGHGGRDYRCGALALPLKHEFEHQLQRASITVLQQPKTEETRATAAARVGLVSHIGGHKWAGNVILYIPVGGRYRGHPLQGSVIWYGRVEPRHVQGIVQETVINGKMIQDLWRGGMRLQRAEDNVSWDTIMSP